MRHRESSKYAPLKPWQIDQVERVETCDGWTETPSVLLNGELCESTILRSMDDVVTPQFKKLQSKGVIVNNEMTQTYEASYDKIVELSTNYGIMVRENCDPQRWIVALEDRITGTYPSSYYIGSFDDALPSIPAVDKQAQIDIALAQAWANAQLDEATALVSAAEGKKTIVSLVAIFIRFVRILRSLKALRLKEVSKELTPKELADRYMELRYALRPLIYDANSVVAAIKHASQQLESRLTFRGFANDINRTVDIDPEWVLQHHEDLWGTFEKLCVREANASHEVDVRAGVLTQLKTLSKLPVWGLTTPIEAAYELTTFSFIIDWFFNVGDTIAAWTPNYGLHPLSSWYVVTETTEQRVELYDSWATAVAGADTNKKPYVHTWDLLSPCMIGKNIITKTRIPDPSRALLPSFKPNLDVLKLTDLLIIGKKLISRR